MNITNVKSLPRGVQVLAGFVGAGSMLGLAYTIFGNTTALVIVGGGIVLVFALLAAYKAILNWFNKRKANPLSQSLAGNAAAAPQGISEPARRARLDDLRRNFDQGVEKFRAAGKNLYSVPWYVLVGEPGSGKTEAIRHCNVGFPPGLQDQLQGAGGTLNMNWWFTNQAIILDTAGRLMFEEVAPGTTNEWAEFLKLLKANRPNCPINGLLLVIPVDTLIKDTADSIEKKAGKIAQQFDQIQRTLGVRFPVFVIITKCDLLNGFREFFDDLNDPQLQHQIMGWSNPAPIDERFDPAAVVNHLETVKQRLVDRRQHLILDPVNTEDPQARRVDQVDALYALPDSITKIGPRLRRYLEMIFVAGEWSPKPLFLRGIYFTSSMTEGSALDAELAEVLGVPVDSLPEGRVWRRDRAYFLRDLFVEKVFREKGLVTRADNADKQQRTRRAIVLTCAILSVVVLLVLTILGSRQLESSIGKHRDFWLGAQDISPTEMHIVDAKANNKYLGVPLVKIGETNKKVTVANFFGSNLDLVKQNIQIPVLFKPMTLIGGNVDSERRTAYRALYESTILSPVYTAARQKIGTLADDWSPDATAGLVQLLKLEYTQATGKLPASDTHPQVELDPLFHMVLAKEDWDMYQGSDSADLQKVADWLYTQDAGGDKSWPPKGLAAGTPESLAAINQGIDATLAYWRRQTGDKSVAMENIAKVRDALRDYQKIETSLLTRRNQSIDNISVYNAYREQWTADLAKLKAAHDDAVKAWTAASKGKADADSIRKLYDAELAHITGDAQKSYEALLKYTLDPPANPDVVKPNASYQGLIAARTSLQNAINDLKTWSTGAAAKATADELSAFDNTYLAMIKGIDNNTHHRFEVQAQLYEVADKKLVTAAPPVNGPLEAEFNAVDKDYNEAIDVVKRLSILASGPEDRLAQAIALSQFTMEASARAKKYLMADGSLKAMTTDPEKWPDVVAEKAKAFKADSLVRPALPLVTFNDAAFSSRFSPDAAGAFAESLDTIHKTATATDAQARILDAAALSTSANNINKSFDAYKDAYIKYWRDQTKDDIRFSYKKYAELSDALVNVTDAGITQALAAYTQKVTNAMKAINATEVESQVRMAPQLVKDECRQALASWTNLGNDPRVARRTILALDAGTFREQYVVASSKTSDSYAARYWQGLPLEALRVLANDGQQEINTGLLELAKYERFPLAAPGDKKEDLTLQEVLAAREALAKVRGAGNGVALNVTPATGNTGGTRTIGQGGVTRDRDVDTNLDRLRGTNLLRDKQDYFDKLERFFVALPSENKPISVSMSIAKDKLKEEGSISYRYSYLGMAQGTKELPEGALVSTRADNVSFEYPGGDIALKFRETPGGPVLLTETFPGNWAIFRILKDPNTKGVTREGNKFTVEYTVTDNNKKTYSLWLVFEFKQPLPDLKDWPVPPAKQ